MSHKIALSETQLDNVIGGHSRGNTIPAIQGLAGMLARIESIFSAINISVVVIANSTINGNVTINLGQSIKT